MFFVKLGGERRSGASTYRLVVVSDWRLYVTNGKQGLAGHSQNAHFYDLQSVRIHPGDRVELNFKKMNFVLEDTIGHARHPRVSPFQVALLWERSAKVASEREREREAAPPSLSLSLGRRRRPHGFFFFFLQAPTWEFRAFRPRVGFVERAKTAPRAR